MQLSNLNKDLQNSRARCETLEKGLRDEQEAYDALVGAPRSQSPDRMDNTEQVQHAGKMGSGERMCQFSTQSCCDESQLRLLPCLNHQATQADENCIHCPSCGLDFTTEKTTVDHVRRNEAAYKVNVDGEMKCSYIDEDHDAKAVVYCHECDDKLCSDCHKLHDTPKRNRNHRVSEIDQSTNIPMTQWLKEAICRDHPDNKLQLYDHTCKKAVCLICVHGAHKDHQNEDLYQAYDVAKGQLEEQVKKQQLKLEDVTGRMKTVTSHQTELRTTQRRLEQVATTVCKGVAAKLLHRQRQLMEEIQVSLQSPYRMVQEKLDALHGVHTSIVSAIAYTKRTLESTRRDELITLTDVLQTKCDENLKMKLPEDDTRATRILLTFQGQRALEELINTFGGLTFSLNMDHIPDSQPTSQELMTMTLRERQANERLEVQIQQKYLDQAELEETVKKEREEHRSQMEKQNEETEALKMQLSNLNKNLQNSRARCETLEKGLREEQEAYDALVGVPRSQSPDRVDNTEQVQHAGKIGSGRECANFQLSHVVMRVSFVFFHAFILPASHALITKLHRRKRPAYTVLPVALTSPWKTTVDHVRSNEAAFKVNVDGEMKCSYIDEDHDAKAVVYCHECDDKLCFDCHKHHDTPKRNRNHRVSEIDQSTNIPMTQWLKEAICRDHPDNKLQLYDHTCKKAVCLICVHGAHKDHQNEDLYQAYDVAKGQLEEQVKKQQLKLEDVTGRMKTVTSHQTELRTTQRRLEQVATKVCKGVAAKLLHRQRQLMEEIQVSLQSPYRMVQEKLDALHGVHISIVSAIA
ncbi:E3 ubiquitin-protein ligase TRIM33-like [Haliotis rubra]|uniref:E3 ubiquitin-protein ligase TRIM33-like n=1 Tax=Haliotis rubra TaxID=36100 RepID=UPI001EE5D3E6|nr:E3 ubiquitin-protein ligase TRIM33-like [Haliotis rubra]